MTENQSLNLTHTMHLKFQDDTICAIATPVGEGGIGIIKISGPEAQAIAQRLFRPAHAAFPLVSHYLHYGWIRDPASDQTVDEVLLSYMAAPHTYTCEDVVEVNCHSGYAVLNRILTLALLAGARLAEPGEFTRRAFLNGRIDLSQAEAVIEVVRSRSEQSLQVANRLLRGDLSDKVHSWHEVILEIQASLEASIDFSEDLEGEPCCDCTRLGQSLEEGLLHPLQEVLQDYQEGRILREGFTLVLVGKPNVGKSSLLNALLKKDRAIVTPISGTTRDTIEDSFILSGIMVRVLDTAGIRQHPDVIESLGIERTFQSVEEADLVLWLIDGSRPITTEDETVFSRIAVKRHVMLLNKIDLPPKVTLEEVRKRFRGDAPMFALSVLDPGDIKNLRSFLTETFLRNPLELGHSTMIPNLRHKECLEGALESLRRAQELLRTRSYGELVSFEFAVARQFLESILGHAPNDGVLDRIFSEFCIGK